MMFSSVASLFSSGVDGAVPSLLVAVPSLLVVVTGGVGAIRKSVLFDGSGVGTDVEEEAGPFADDATLMVDAGPDDASLPEANASGVGESSADGSEVSTGAEAGAGAETGARDGDGAGPGPGPGPGLGLRLGLGRGRRMILVSRQMGLAQTVR